ncbi:MAG: chromosome partitioning protein ParB [Acidobacteria bacterium]|nr:MAG: chromosome partitioning protein ParB [Acidobacteriota bacterium]
MAERKALGRGLSALLGTPDLEADKLIEIDIERILPNAHQPRKSFDEESLNELANSIRAHGVVQPIVVRPLPDGFFQLIAGERRWRAAQRARLSRIPAVVRDTDEHAALEIALIENLQREDLNPIEEALAYERLIVEFSMTQEEVAHRVGKNRATVANMLRLLKLPPEVQQWLREDRLTTGHAKALLSLSDLTQILDSARKIIQGNYSVRQAEMLVSRYSRNASDKNEPASRSENLDPNVKVAIHALEQVLGTKVSIQQEGGRGKIEIHFFSLEEMNRLYEGLLKAKF